MESIADGDLVGSLEHGREMGQGSAAADALTAMRRTMTRETILRAIASGKGAGYSGRMPGIVDEVLLHGDAGRRVVPLAAFGGATREVAAAMV